MCLRFDLRVSDLYARNYTCQLPNQDGDFQVFSIPSLKVLQEDFDNNDFIR